MKIGFHLPISKGFLWTLKEAERLDCEVAQVFLKNPRSWQQKKLSDKDKADFQLLYRQVSLVGHLSYLPNLARIDEDERHLAGFVHEVSLCSELGLDRLVIHLGSREDTKRGIAMIVEAINHVHRRYDIHLLLENSSGQGTAIGKDAVELAAVYEGITRKEKVALCIDTAHLFEAGCNVRSKTTWNGFIREIQKRLGAGKIGFFHLNDSKTLSGSRVDRHWHIGAGEIGIDFFRFLLNDKRFAHLEGVMETPKMGKMDEENMKTMRSLLPPLVPRPLS